MSEEITLDEEMITKCETAHDKICNVLQDTLGRENSLQVFSAGCSVLLGILCASMLREGVPKQALLQAVDLTYDKLEKTVDKEY